MKNSVAEKTTIFAQVRFFSFFLFLCRLTKTNGSAKGLIAQCSEVCDRGAVNMVDRGPCAQCFERRNFCIEHACHDES
jgi:hypothetical protein